MRVATYTRAQGACAPEHLAAQARALRTQITANRDWEPGTRFVDMASAADPNRPALRRALEHAQRGDYDILLICAADRLARSIEGLNGIVGPLAAAGVSVRCPDGTGLDPSHLAAISDALGRLRRTVNR